MPLGATTQIQLVSRSEGNVTEDERKDGALTEEPSGLPKRFGDGEEKENDGKGDVCAGI